jgi:hypothetical protein
MNRQVTPLPNPLSLSNITCDSLCRTLPKECVDLLIEKELDRRSVWLLGNLLFSTKEHALKYLSEYKEKGGGVLSDAQPIRVILDRAPKTVLFVERSEDGIWEDILEMTFSPVLSIFTTKKELKASNNGHDMDMYALRTFKNHLVNGQWVLFKK